MPSRWFLVFALLLVVIALASIGSFEQKEHFGTYDNDYPTSMEIYVPNNNTLKTSLSYETDINKVFRPNNTPAMTFSYQTSPILYGGLPRAVFSVQVESLDFMISYGLKVSWQPLELERVSYIKTSLDEIYNSTTSTMLFLADNPDFVDDDNISTNDNKAMTPNSKRIMITDGLGKKIEHPLFAAMRTHTNNTTKNLGIVTMANLEDDFINKKKIVPLTGGNKGYYNPTHRYQGVLRYRRQNAQKKWETRYVRVSYNTLLPSYESIDGTTTSDIYPKSVTDMLDALTKPEDDKY